MSSQNLGKKQIPKALQVNSSLEDGGGCSFGKRFAWNPF